jgi:hypothetical protein
VARSRSWAVARAVPRVPFRAAEPSSLGPTGLISCRAPFPWLPSPCADQWVLVFARARETKETRSKPERQPQEARNSIHADERALATPRRVNAPCACGVSQEVEQKLAPQRNSVRLELLASRASRVGGLRAPAGI